MKNMPAGFKPIGTVAVRGFELPKPDWNFWGKHYDVELWQAAALSLNINPDAIKDPEHFYINEYKDRLRLLVNWLAPRDEHPYQVRVMLCELAGRWSKVLKWQIPPELAALARHYDEPTKTKTAAPAARVEAGAGTNPNDDAIPGKMPNTTIGKLAIKAAWEIEYKTKKRATAKQVIERLQAWVDHISNPNAVTELTKKISNGVKWVTTGGKERDYDIGACQKTLETWQKSRA